MLIANGSWSRGLPHHDWVIIQGHQTARAIQRAVTSMARTRYWPGRRLAAPRTGYSHASRATRSKTRCYTGDAALVAAPEAPVARRGPRVARPRASSPSSGQAACPQASSAEGGKQRSGPARYDSKAHHREQVETPLC